MYSSTFLISCKLFHPGFMCIKPRGKLSTCRECPPWMFHMASQVTISIESSSRSPCTCLQHMTSRLETVPPRPAPHDDDNLWLGATVKSISKPENKPCQRLSTTRILTSLVPFRGPASSRSPDNQTCIINNNAENLELKGLPRAALIRCLLFVAGRGGAGQVRGAAEHCGGVVSALSESTYEFKWLY